MAVLELWIPNARIISIKAIVDGQSQTDPQFRTNRLYTRLTAAEVRRQLIVQKGYTDAELPTVRTIRTKLNDLGYHPTTVAKAKPKKRSRRPMPSLNESRSYIRRRMPTHRRCACRSMQKRR